MTRLLVALLLCVRFSPGGDDGLAVLQKNCVRCHGGATPTAKLDLSSLEGIIKGGNQGPAIKLGDPDHSLIWLAVQDDINKVPRTGQMPPFRRITPAEITTLRNWIQNLRP